MATGVHTGDIIIPAGQAVPFFGSLNMAVPLAQCQLFIQTETGNPPKLVQSLTSTEGPYVGSAREPDNVLGQTSATMQFYGGWDEFYLYAPQNAVTVSVAVLPMTGA